MRSSISVLLSVVVCCFFFHGQAFASLIVSSASHRSTSVISYGEMSDWEPAELIISSDNSTPPIISSGDISLCVGDHCSPALPNNPAEQPDALHLSFDASVGGNLYLDYSVFSHEEGFLDGIDKTISLTAENITLFDATPQLLPPSTNLTVLTLHDYMSPLSLSMGGDLLLFADRPYTDSTFTFSAAQSLYVGNYSAYAPVPLPASLVFILTGVIGSVGIRRKKPARRQN